MPRAGLRPSVRRRAKDATPTRDTQRAVYLYCVVRSAKQPSVAGVPGGLPGGVTPYAIAAGRSLWLVISDVPLDRYGPEPLEAALRDLEWVTAVAVAHEAVVEHFARLRTATVVPMKLFTMFSTEARAVEEMRTRRKEIQQVLKRIAGCEEWGIRIVRDASPAASAATPERRSGTAFLAARKKTRDDARAAAESAAEAAASVFEALAPFAKDARRRDESPAGAQPPLLAAAFLIRTAMRAKFRAAARRAAKQSVAAGARMTLTGPWPAYNFVQPPAGRA
jgi:gas vesicle protein GvpL/GvpF